MILIISPVKNTGNISFDELFRDKIAEWIIGWFL